MVKHSRIRTNQKIIIAIIVVLVAVIAIAVFFILPKIFKPETAEEKPTDSSQSEEKPETQTPSANTDKDGNPLPDDSNPPKETSDSNQISMHISQENGNVIISTNLGYISTGTCLIKTSTGYSQSATVMFTPEYSTCAGFSIPVSAVGTGNITFTLEVTTADATLVKSQEFAAQ